MQCRKGGWSDRRAGSGSFRCDGHQIIDKPTYQKLTKPFIKHGGIIIRGQEAENHLKDRAYASYLPGMNTAFIRDDATISDVLEEMYHAEQHEKMDNHTFERLKNRVYFVCKSMMSLMMKDVFIFTNLLPN